MVSRRGLFGAAGLALAAGPALAAAPAKTADVFGLKPITAGVQPISRAERAARIAKAQRLMAERGVAALLLEPGSAMTYFTGVRWNRSERTTAAVIPARGQPVIVTPAFEVPSVEESLEIEAEVRPWDEHESPFVRIAQALADRGVASGVVGVEPTDASSSSRACAPPRRARPSLRPMRSCAPAA